MKCLPERISLTCEPLKLPDISILFKSTVQIVPSKWIAGTMLITIKAEDKNIFTNYVFDKRGAQIHEDTKGYLYNSKR